MTRREKNIIYGVGALLVLILFVVYVLIPFFSDVFGIGERTRNAEKRFLRMEKLIKQQNFLVQDLSKVKAIESKIMNKLYRGNDPSKIMPLIHSFLTSVASKNDIEVRRLNNIKSNFVFSRKILKKYPFLKNVEMVGVLVEARGRPDQMYKFIDEIEKSDKYLEFSNFSVNAWNNRPDKTVNFRMNLFTYFIKNPPRGTPAKKGVRKNRKK